MQIGSDAELNLGSPFILPERGWQQARVDFLRNELVAYRVAIRDLLKGTSNTFLI